MTPITTKNNGVMLAINALQMGDKDFGASKVMISLAI
jgi:hypothetical protein